MKKPRVYELYDTWNGVSCYSKWYGVVSKRIYKVRAKSVKQAYFLATHKIPIDSNGCGVEEVFENYLG